MKGWPATSAAVVAAAAGMTAVYRFDPVTAGFFPQCAFHSLTGLQCPGCGATRALHSLLHGHVWQAFLFNPLLFLAAPFLVAGLVAHYRGRPFWSGRWSGWCACAVVVAYWIVRNTPLWYSP